jgi:hypothetical protein
MKKMSLLLFGFLFVVFWGCATGAPVITTTEQEMTSTPQYRLYTKTPGSNIVSNQFSWREKFQLCLWRGSGENVTFYITSKFRLYIEGQKKGMGEALRYEKTVDIPASEQGICIDIDGMSRAGEYYAEAIIGGKRVASWNLKIRR